MRPMKEQLNRAMEMSMEERNGTGESNGREQWGKAMEEDSEREQWNNAGEQWDLVS